MKRNSTIIYSVNNCEMPTVKVIDLECFLDDVDGDLEEIFGCAELEAPTDRVKAALKECIG